MGPRFARRVFTIAAIYGLAVLVPQYFMETRIGLDTPPPITHPEHFYGFIGVALAWQVAFLVIARDVARFRPLMPVAVLEKLSFGIPAQVLWLTGRAAGAVAAVGAIDLILAGLFVLAHRATRPGAVVA